MDATTTKQPASPVHGILRKLPTSRKLQLIVFVFVGIVFSVLALVYLGARITSAARAYVAGEGLWSKAQKEAAIRLQEYAYTRDERDYQEFLESLSVPLGDRKARLEMEKPHCDDRVAAAGFRQGKIPEPDIPGLIMLFRRFRRTEVITTAATIWEQGDNEIDKLRIVGAQLHEAITSGNTSQRQIATLAVQIEDEDGKLTPLERDFSVGLSNGARRIDRLVMIGLPLAGLVLLGLGLAVSGLIVREIESNEADRGRAEAATRQSEQRYRELLENANDIVYLHDLEGYFLSWNRKAEELLGYKMSDHPRLHVRDVVAPEDQVLIEVIMAEKLTGRNSAPYSLRLVSKDGKRCEVEVSSRLLTENGHAVGVQGIARDLTERRRLEAELLQAQKMEAVGRLAGGIAHDFNNILMIVRGYAESLLERLHPEDPLHAQAEQIQKAAQRASELTHRLLGFSRKQVFEPKVLELNQAIAEVSKMLPRLLGSHIDFSLDLRPEAGHVNVDPIQLEQVLINLAVNSRDAMPQGGTLIIGTGCRELEQTDQDRGTSVIPGRYAELSAQDSGCGIAKADLAHIFEPFFTTKDKDKGTGLGLSTVYGIVKRSGGYIFVSSEVGTGTTIRVYLPQVLQERKEAEPEKMASQQDHRGGTVLIAEDEEALRTLIGGMMRAEGFEVLEAANGEEAVAIAERYHGRIYLLLTDVIMPRLRGPEAAARIRLRYPDIKVVFMSGYTESALIQDGMLASNTLLLQKPFTVKKVLEAIRHLNVNARA
jgi:PAS domain S-box-containing protein